MLSTKKTIRNGENGGSIGSNAGDYILCVFGRMTQKVWLPNPRAYRVTTYFSIASYGAVSAVKLFQI